MLNEACKIHLKNDNKMIEEYAHFINQLTTLSKSTSYLNHGKVI